MLFVVGSLLAVLAVACWWEARSGKPEWGAHLGPGGPATGPTTRDGSTAAKAGLAATLGTAAAMFVAGGGDG